MEMTQVGIYQIRNILNGHCYIGQTTNLSGRWGEHRRDLRGGRHHSGHLRNAWNKYGEASFVFEVLAQINWPISKRELTDLEQDYVDFFLPAYNAKMECVESNRGVKLTPETRAKIAASRLGKHYPKLAIAKAGVRHTEETKAKMSASKIGKTKSPETRARMSASLIGNLRSVGRVASAETRAKMSAAHLGKRHSAETRQKMSEAARCWWGAKKA